VERFHVPDDRVDWTVDWPDYSPPTFTSPGAIGKPWSDPEHRYCSEMFVIEAFQSVRQSVAGLLGNGYCIVKT